ncbi:MAG: class I SAM-dependent methyltransferase [Planctomycetota bacterium]
MELHEKVIRRLEDFILDDRQLRSVGNLSFEHRGKQEIAYPYLRALNGPLVNAVGALIKRDGRAPDALRFLEVGCGIGTKCELVRLLGVSATGIDLLPEYVELAKKVFAECAFLHANALEFDYHGFDIVYYHAPFFDDHLIESLESRVLSQLPVGGVLIATRISPAFAAVLDSNGTDRGDWMAERSTLEVDVGRLVVVKKS